MLRARRPLGRANLAVLAAVLMWGANFPAIKLALRSMPALVLAPVRFTVAAVLLFAILAAREGSVRVARRDLRNLLVIGAIGFGLNQFGFLGGLSLTDASSAALIFATAPVVTAVLAAWRYGEPLTRWAGVGLVLSTLGVALIIAPHGFSHLAGAAGKLTGDLLICATVGTVVYSALAVKAPLRRLSPLRVTTWAATAGAVLLIVAGAPALVRFDWGSVSPGGWLVIAYVTLAATVVTNLLWNFGIRELGASRVMAYSLLEPGVAVALAAVLLGEQLTPLQVAGALVVLVGLVLHTLSPAVSVQREAEPAVGTESTILAEEVAGLHPRAGPLGEHASQEDEHFGRDLPGEHQAHGDVEQPRR